MDTRRIDDYAIIGNARSAALIRNDGAIEWLPLPTFESDSFFGAILDPERGGSFCICPKGLKADSHWRKNVWRRYTPDTVVLETRFKVHGGPPM